MPPRIMPPRIISPRVVVPSRILPPAVVAPKMPSLPAKPSMPTGPDWKRILEVGMRFTELRRSQAHAIASDLVAHGHLARDQMAGVVDELVDLSRRRRNDLRRIVQHEVSRQLGALGLATKADLAALERRLTKAAREKKAPAKKAGSAKAASKKAAVKPARKAG